MIRLIFVSILFLTSTSFSKTYELNFESSCFEYTGRKNEIIQTAMNVWNSIPHNPITFVRGEDILEEIEVTNWDLFLWNPYYPTADIRSWNAVVCDDVGNMYQSFGFLPFNHVIHGMALKPTPYSDHIGVYLNLAHDMKEVSFDDWQYLENPDQFIDYSRPADFETATVLLAHELGHIVGVGHLPTVGPPTGAYWPIMWWNNFSETPELMREDWELYNSQVKWKAHGESGGIGFEYKIEAGILTVAFTSYFNRYLQRGKAHIVAQIGEGEWYHFNEGRWETGDPLSGGIDVVLTLRNEYQIYRGPWNFNDSITIYMGFEIDGTLYWNENDPIIFQGAVQ